LKVLAIGAVMGAIAGYVVPIAFHGIGSVVKKPFKSAPAPITREVAIVNEYVQQTRDAQFWGPKPAIYRDSVSYFLRNFDAYDPRRPHTFRETNVRMFIPELVRSTGLIAGLPVTTVGEVVSAEVGLGFPPYVESVVQLKPITVNDGLVYCRVTTSADRRFHLHELLLARGIVIAGGNVPLMTGRGYAPTAYMVCSAVKDVPAAIARALRREQRRAQRAQRGSSRQ
jgi:hypothetical protein